MCGTDPDGVNLTCKLVVFGCSYRLLYVHETSAASIAFYAMARYGPPWTISDRWGSLRTSYMLYELHAVRGRVSFDLIPGDIMLTRILGKLSGRSAVRSVRLYRMHASIDNRCMHAVG